VILAVVTELLHANVYGDVPPVTETEAAPSDKPLQLMLVPTILDDSAAG